MLTVSCVLTGDKYTEEDVYRLQKNVKDNITLPYHFVCLSDREIDGVDTILLPKNDWGVWNKMYLFKYLTYTIYFDLDVHIQNNIDYLVRNQLTVIQCVWKPFWEDNTQIGYMNTQKNSSIMSWRGEQNKVIFDKFMEDPDYFMVRYPGTDRYLDHEWFVKTFPRNVAYSRAYGIDEHTLPNDGTFFKSNDHIVCLYNGHGKQKMKEDLNEKI